MASLSLVFAFVLAYGQIDALKTPRLAFNV